MLIPVIVDKNFSNKDTQPTSFFSQNKDALLISFSADWNNLKSPSIAG
jgi:hypothetical protein